MNYTTANKAAIGNLLRAGVPEHHMERLIKLALATLVFIAFSYIISSAYLGINGHHTWRQADVYGYMLGFMHARGFTELDRFLIDLGKMMYEVPIYHYLIAKASLLTGSDPLVTTRFFNLGFWSLTAFAGYSLGKSWGGTVAGLIFLGLFSTSPLILHYYSVPIPDTMGIAVSLTGVLLLLKFGISWRGVLFALPFLMAGAFTKPPIAFVFVVFFAAYLLIKPSAAGGMAEYSSTLPPPPIKSSA